MIPHESLGKEVYNVNVFGVRNALSLLLDHPCVYYSCSHYERAADQAYRLHRNAQQQGIGELITIRRVGRRVVAERGPEFNYDRVAHNCHTMPEDGDSGPALAGFSPERMGETFTWSEHGAAVFDDIEEDEDIDE